MICNRISLSLAERSKNKLVVLGILCWDFGGILIKMDYWFFGDDPEIGSNRNFVQNGSNFLTDFESD
jgi:hypothetical protein